MQSKFTSRRRWGKESWRSRLERRFWGKVDKTPGHGPLGDCWLWIGARDKRYGSISALRPDEGFNTTKAYVVSFLLHHGPVPKGLEVCHKCDVGYCVNPSHLWIGTHKQNMLDAKNKGRMLKPWLHVPLEVQQAIKNAQGKYRDVGRRFNVSPGTVSLIKNNNYPFKKGRYPTRGRPPKMLRAECDAIKNAIGLQHEIAARFGVSQMQVSRIKRGLVTVFADKEMAA